MKEVINVRTLHNLLLVIGADDIQKIRPDWPHERAERFLGENQDALYEAIYQAAMQVIRNFVILTEKERKTMEIKWRKGRE
ncbi:hypothetical protein GFC01_05910 [Desulfofundulus thermobenzoicus]|uniref:Uncharacterized protein n=1 Tax=Desulfofundulus thermobenzoicus TaxID=29376 RepID=A0A6N7IP86_9FIRM|nr:hypothetical protein [Desulfofundulus thermobenzoicus]MQL51804.1 hypothetical protein [Desulfofundulus thermobenzoicus]